MNPPPETDRTKGIGGTDSAAVLGVHPYKTALDVYLDKIGEAPDREFNPMMQWGLLHEDSIAKAYTKATGRRVFRVNQTQRYEPHPFIMAHLDRRIQHQADGLRRVLEIKTAYPRTRDQWDRWGEEHSDVVPEEYQCQAMHYLAVTGYDVCDLAVLLAGHDFRVYTINRDEELIEYMIEQECRFWRLHVEPRVPPDATSIDDARALWPSNDGTLVEADADLLKTLDEFVALKAKAKEIEAQAKEHQLTLMQAIGEADGIVDTSGHTRLTWKAQTSRRIDIRALCADHAELAEKYRTASTSRVMRTKKPPKNKEN